MEGGSDTFISHPKITGIAPSIIFNTQNMRSQIFSWRYKRNRGAIDIKPTHEKQNPNPLELHHLYTIHLNMDGAHS